MLHNINFIFTFKDKNEITANLAIKHEELKTKRKLLLAIKKILKHQYNDLVKLKIQIHDNNFLPDYCRRNGGVIYSKPIN